MAGSTVFIVDNDEGVRDSLVAVLESEGRQVRSFASADEFLASGVYRQPGCLVLDHHMPVTTGLDLLDKSNSLGIGLPTIIMTGLSDPRICRRAAAAGAIAVLEKPFAVDALFSLIQTASSVSPQKP